MPLQLIDSDDTFSVKDSELAGPGITNVDPDTEYTLRPISVDDHRALQKKHTKEEIDRRTHQKVPRVNDEALSDDLIDFVLVGWTGILWKGQPAPCERVHKLRLDGARRLALLDRAGMNQVQSASEVRAASFRQPA